MPTFVASACERRTGAGAESSAEIHRMLMGVLRAMTFGKNNAPTSAASQPRSVSPAVAAAARL